ncbi:bromodomain protein [Actinidia rufa]|uniref:Bromodomain protein n=1 Tax=Actinidia rufa TaxID=165716 RepID=A0A7J0F6Z2_9ERIC|nr:bromodomain protein [Actinidia rufa]
MWASMASWFTPTVFFCIVNLIIGTIFITSNLITHKNHHQNIEGEHDPTRMVRALPFLDRVKYFDFALKTHDNHLQLQEGEHNPTRIVRSPSLLDRVKSFDFSLKTHDNHQLQIQEGEHNPTRVGRSPSFLDRVKSLDFSPKTHQKKIPHEGEQDLTRMVRTPTLLDRIKSFDFSPRTPKNDHLQQADGENGPTRLANVPSLLDRIKSFDFSPRGSNKPDPPHEEDRERNETASFTEESEDEEVDAKADDFINRFKHQLKLQRLDSFMRYREMLNRGLAK